MKRKRLLLLPLLLMAVAVSAEPIVRVVRTGGPDKAFATGDVRKLVLSADAVDVVNPEGTVLLSVPKADIARVEFTDGTPDSDAIDAILVQDEETVKIIKDGQVYILQGGKKYTIMGVGVKNIND